MDGGGGGDGPLHRFSRDFVEPNALGSGNRQSEDFANMPRNGLAFSVVVGGQYDFYGRKLT
jgi:hypothetical protein